MHKDLYKHLGLFKVTWIKLYAFAIVCKRSPIQIGVDL